MRNIFKLACVLFCTVGLVPNLMGCNKINKAEQRKTMSRDEFGAKLVVGMSEQEVLAAVGTPKCWRLDHRSSRHRQLFHEPVTLAPGSR